MGKRNYINNFLKGKFQLDEKDNSNIREREREREGRKVLANNSDYPSVHTYILYLGISNFS